MARFSFSHREPELLFPEESILSKEKTFLVLRKKEEEAVLQEMSKNLHIDLSIGKSAWYILGCRKQFNWTISSLLLRRFILMFCNMKG